MYRFPWYLTLVSTNHASSNPGLVAYRRWSFARKGMADPEGEGPDLPLFLDQTEARGAEKTSFGDRPPPPPLSQGLDDRPAPASLSKGLAPPLNRTIRGVFREVRTHLFYGK